MLDAINHTNAESLRRRFFVTKRAFSDKEKAFFMNVDFVKHVALVAEIDENGRHFDHRRRTLHRYRARRGRNRLCGRRCLSGTGIGTLLMRHLAVIARTAGLKELIADVFRRTTPCERFSASSAFRRAAAPTHR